VPLEAHVRSLFPVYFVRFLINEITTSNKTGKPRNKTRGGVISIPVMVAHGSLVPAPLKMYAIKRETIRKSNPNVKMLKIFIGYGNSLEYTFPQGSKLSKLKSKRERV